MVPEVPILGKVCTIEGEFFLCDGRAPDEPFRQKAAVDYNFAILKSNLQKAVRLMRGKKAYRTMWQMLRQNPNELLKWLILLMCRDTLVCPEHFVELVWLQAATSRGYLLRVADVKRLDDILATLLESQGRYVLFQEIATDSGKIGDPTMDCAFSIAKGSAARMEDKIILNCLRNRFNEGELPLQEPVYLEEAPPYEEFHPLRHMIPQAIDMTCFPNMIQELGNPEITEEMLWWHWGSYNVRQRVSLGAVDQDEFEMHQRIKHKLKHSDVVDSYAAAKIAYMVKDE